MQILDPLLEAERWGLITDFDGVLSPIVANRDEAQISPRNRDLLGQLAEKITLVAVVSGRGVADLQARIHLPKVVYVGNHGLERWQDGAVLPLPAAQAYRPALEALQADLILPVGVELEDKGATLSLHYRHAPESAEQLGAHLRDLAHKHTLKFSGGKMVYEIRPPLEVNKGTTLADLVREYALHAVLCLGDDLTDVDMFKTVQQLRAEGLCQGYAIGVTGAETPAAVREHADILVDEVESLFAYLLARSAS